MQLCLAQLSSDERDGVFVFKPKQLTDRWRGVDLYGCDKPCPSLATFQACVIKLLCMFKDGTPCETFSICTDPEAAAAAASGSWHGDSICSIHS